MIIKRTLLACALACLGTSQAFAVTKPLDNAQIEKDMQQLMTRTQQLQQEVTSLRQQVKQLKKHKTQQSKQGQADQTRTRQLVLKRSVPVSEKEVHEKYDALHAQQEHDHPLQKQYDLYDSHGLTYLAGTPVITSPYLGVRSNYNGSDLIVNILKINEDLRLLQQRQKLENAVHAAGFANPPHAIMDISGKVEGLGFVSKPYVGRTTGDVDLGTAELDAFVQVNSWSNAYIAMDYDNTPQTISGQRAHNSRIFLDKGFATIGNLNKFPVYFTIGQLYVPFGSYDSYMLSSPLTQVLARTRSRVVELGYKQPGVGGFHAEVYGFNGDSGVAARGVGGANLSYHIINNSWSGTIGAGLISNIADSDGMQSTGGSGFTGFDTNSISEKISQKIPAADGHANVSIGPVDLMGEYITVVRRFNAMDLTYGNVGADPSAWNFEAAYRTKLFDKPTSFAIGYGGTRQALALNLPEQRFIAAINMSIWRDTIETLEFRHDINYPVGTIAAGRGFDGTLIPVNPGLALGHSSNMLTAQIGVYF